MPRPILILLLIVMVIIGVMLALASFDRPVPVAHVEQPVTNAAAH